MPHQLPLWVLATPTVVLVFIAIVNKINGR